MTVEPLSLRNGTPASLNHLDGGIDQPELKIIDVFICKHCKNPANASEGHNFSETIRGRTTCCASRTRPKGAPPPDQGSSESRSGPRLPIEPRRK